MMAAEIVIPGLFLILVAGALACAPLSNARLMLRIPAFSSLCVFLLGILLVPNLKSGPCLVYGDNLIVDHLSLYHVFLVNLIFLVSSVYALGYFKNKIRNAKSKDENRNASATESLFHTPGYIKRYCIFWQVFHGTLLLVLFSNNIGVMWVALEATTLVSAFLIVSESNSLSIEAMWKYLLICSVGIAFAFMGTILTVAAAKNLQPQDSVFLFSRLYQHADQIDPKLMLLAFVFIVVGFGTKAGLSPMHTWLPDAHSQAPTPVSAVFSGVMLNCALYCIMRYLPVSEAAMGMNGEAHSILLLFGFSSLVFAAVFIPIQHDVKRLLAYHSVEHMGIIVVGLGIGGMGTFAALLHVANHSISKVLAFFSAGKISDFYGTRDMRDIGSASSQIPLWGNAFFLSILALIGVAPFSVFISEFLIVREAFVNENFLVVGLFLFCALAVFISALKHAMDVSFGKSTPLQTTPEKVRILDVMIVVLCIAALLLLGVWIPAPFGDFLKNAAAEIGGGL